MPRHGSLVKKFKVKPKKASDYVARETRLVIEQMLVQPLWRNGEENGQRAAKLVGFDFLGRYTAPVKRLKGGLYQVEDFDHGILTGKEIAVGADGKTARKTGDWETILPGGERVVTRYAAELDTGFQDLQPYRSFLLPDGKKMWGQAVDENILWRKRYNVDGNLISRQDFSENANAMGVSGNADTTPKKTGGLVL